MQDACHTNFVMDLAHRGVSVGQWLEHRSAECEDLRFDFSWGLRIFSLSHARDKTKTSFCLLAPLSPSKILLGGVSGRFIPSQSRRFVRNE